MTERTGVTLRPSRKAASTAIALVLGMCSFIAGGSSHANNGGKPEPVTFSFDIPANSIKPGACAFDVNWSGSGAGKAIALSGNRFVLTSPTLRVTVTNLSDPSKAVTLNVPGAFHQSTQNGNLVTVVTGRNLLGDPDAGMVLAIGTFSFVFDANNTLIQPLVGNGQLINVCELIS